MDSEDLPAISCFPTPPSSERLNTIKLFQKFIHLWHYVAINLYLYIHARYFKSTVFIFILNRCYDIYFVCYMTINRNQIHVTFLYLEFLLRYLNIDCEFEVQKKLWPNPDKLISIMPMEYWTPYPWYIDSNSHRILTPLLS